MTKKSHPVITSSKAKNHIFGAHTYMSNLKNDIMLHKQKVEQIQAEQQIKAEEQKKIDDQNKSKIMLERVKKLL